MLRLCYLQILKSTKKAKFWNLAWQNRQFCKASLNEIYITYVFYCLVIMGIFQVTRFWFKQLLKQVSFLVAQEEIFIV